MALSLQKDHSPSLPFPQGRELGPVSKILRLSSEQKIGYGCPKLWVTVVTEVA